MLYLVLQKVINRKTKEKDLTPIQSGKYVAMNSVGDEEAESDFTSGATLIREKTAEALKRLH